MGSNPVMGLEFILSNVDLKRRQCVAVDIYLFISNHCRNLSLFTHFVFVIDGRPLFCYEYFMLNFSFSFNKLINTFRKEFIEMKEEVSQAKNSLLRDSNRDMVQSRTIDKMKAERRETFCVQAHIRQEMEKERQELEKKVQSSIH